MKKIIVPVVRLSCRFLFFVLTSFLLVSCGGNRDYTSQDVIDAFKEEGLEAESPVPIDPNEDSPLPKSFIEAQRFLIPSLGEDKGGRVFSFETEDELNMVKHYYENLPGPLTTWVFVKGNILVQINSDLPKESADKYREVLEGMD